jgi:uncharacterized protein
VNVGRVLEIGHFPVKSMLGAALDRVAVDASGLRGDRCWALVDAETGKVASAKDPRKWAGLLRFRARYVGDGSAGAPIAITLPDGTEVRSDDPAVSDRVSAAVGRPVRLVSEPVETGYDYVWEVDDIAPIEVVTGTQNDTTAEGHPVSTMPLAMEAPGTFQDVAPITVLTTAALRAMAARHPEGSWHPARFRANLLVDADGDEVVENDWIGRQVQVGAAVIEVTALSPRCVMTTLAQPGLERDRGILRTVATHNRQEFAGFGQWACLGAYAKVVTPGAVALGDAVALL